VGSSGILLQPVGRDDCMGGTAQNGTASAVSGMALRNATGHAT